MKSFTLSGLCDIGPVKRNPKAAPRSWRFSMLLVLAGVLPSLAQMPPNLENGFKHWGSYDGGSLDTVNNLNGNQMLHAPLLPNYPQRGGGLTVQSSLYQTSKVWQVYCTVDLNNVGYCQWSLQRPGIDLRQSESLTVMRTMDHYGSGTGQVSYRAYGYSILDGNATSHQLAATGPLDSTGESTKFDSVDTTGYHLEMSNPDAYGVMATATVTDRHGKQYVATGFGGTTDPCPALGTNHLPPVRIGGGYVAPIIDDAPMGDQYCPQIAYAQQVTDSNGNQITNPSSAVTDTLGRSFVFFNGGLQTTDYTGCMSSRAIIYATMQSYIAPDGSTQQMKLCYGAVPVQTAFNVSGIAENGGYSQQLVTVALADGTKWTFDADTYGQVTLVGLPMGGSISYTWTTIAFPACAPQDGGVSRAVATRTVNDNNGHAYTWHYIWGTVVNGVISNTVTDPNGNDTVHVFTALDGASLGYCGFYETRTQSYQGTGSSRQLLKQVDTTYAKAFFSIETTVGNGMGNVVPTSVQTTIYPSGKVSLLTKTYAAAPVSGGPISGAVAAEKEYDWGPGAPGLLLRETDTTYQWQVNTAYLTANLVDLPATVIVKDGNGNRVAETDYTYDEPAYLTAANISTQHVAPPNGVRGNLTTVSKWLNTSNSFITTHTNWYDTGEPYKQIDPLGRSTTHSYDPFYAGAYSTQSCSPATNGGTVAHCVSGTYDFATGVLTSLTNENASTQASGNTPGDSAHTSNYNYDFMWRITSVKAPPDPANGNAQAQTTLTYSASGTYPLSIQQQKSVTNTLSDSATALFDGLARSYQGQHVTLGGSVTVNTTYDGLGHVASVTNPFYSTADPTYGVTSSQYDGLGRVTQVTKQDGSVNTVSYSDNCTTAVDEAGKQRKSCSDGLGRLIEVDEPNPGAAASSATGWIAVSGSEQTANSQAATPGSGTVTITGTEGTGQYCTVHCVNVWDTGKVTLGVGSYPAKTYTYGKFDNAASVAWNLSCAFHNDNASPVDAFCPASAGTSTTVNLVARTTGAATNYSLSTSSATTDPTGTFSGPSFFASPANGAMTQGQNASSTPDTGTVTATIGGTNYTVSFAAADTAATIAGNLATAISAGTLANASASGSTVNLSSKTTGPGGDYSIAASYTWNSGQFTNASFTTSTSGGSLSGGYVASDLNNNPFVTLYQYDTLGNLLRVDQKGSAPSDSTKWRTRLFTYDSFSRLLTAYNPESGTIAYSYDANGNLLQKTSPAPNQTGSATQTISYCYDELNRVTGRAYSAQSCSGTQLPAGTAAASYVYDSGANAKGKLTSFTDQAGSGSYTYDVLGRMSGETRVIAGISKSMSYAYNLDGSLKTLTYPSGASVTYTPDSAGRTLSAVDTGNGINYATSATYGPDSGLTGFVSGNTGGFAGITNAFSYNKRLQPTNMSATSPSQTVFSIGYDFHVGAGDNGNVWGITNNKDATRNQSFTYDPLNRLTSAQNAGTNCAATTVNGKTEYWGNSYGYDAWGNLLQKIVTKCSGENLSVAVLANNQLSGYGFDAAGNMTSDPTDGVTSTYDPENRIATATRNGVTTAYTYDDDGNRVEKTSGTGSSGGTLYWYMSPGIVAESDLSGNLQSEYVFFDGERVARKDFPGLAVSYYFSDHLKTASVITDAAGNIKSESDYYPWGGELQLLANDSNHYKFTGKERDSETGLDYFGARYYSNGLGRWVTPDAPLADQHLHNPQSWNLYMYAANRPTSLIDPNGERVIEAPVKYVPYTVHGDNAAAAFNNAKQASGLKTETGEPMSGQTKADMTVQITQITVETTPGTALVPTEVTETVASADVKLSPEVTVPEWAEYASASPAEQKTWDDGIASLKDHESGHVKIAEQGAQALDKSLPGTRGVGVGANQQKATQQAKDRLKQQVQKKANAQVDKTNQKQEQYDKCTGHGKDKTASACI